MDPVRGLFFHKYQKSKTGLKQACFLLRRSGDGASDESGWSEWSPWSQCSVECGGGQQFRLRVCEKGNCDGTAKMARACNTHSCKGTV